MIKVNKIEPQGYCNGVKRALNIVNDAIEDPKTKKPIYLLGQIIHNKYVVDMLIDAGVKVIDDKNKTRLELLDLINDGSVVLSAHGVSPDVYTKAINKGLNIIDTTCGNVLIVHKKIKQFLDLNYTCLYIGTPNHPECEGVLGISNEIKLISNINDLDNLRITGNIYVTNQTTLSKFDIADIYKKINELYPKAILDDKICNATTIRQNAMANQKKADLCIVVGDKKSSNTKKLVKVSQDIAKIPTVLCENLDDLDKSLLNNIKTVNISSGASTPDLLVNEIINYIEALK